MQAFGGNNLVKPAQAPESVLQYAYSPTEQPPRSRISIKEFVFHCTKMLEPYLTMPKNDTFARRATNDLNELLGQIHFHRQKVEIFPEVFLTGFQMHAVPPSQSRNGRARVEVTRIETESMMDHPEHFGDSVYVGRKSGSEIFIGYQAPLPPTLVFYKDAFHKPGGTDYMSFNPAYLELTTDNPDYELIKEGIQRYIVAFGFIAMSD